MQDELVVTLSAAEGFSLGSMLRKPAAHMPLPGHTAWLAEDRAIDLFYPFQDVAALRMQIAAVCAANPVDIFIQPVANRKKKIFVADMESTVIEQEMLDELAGFVGAREKTAEITRRAMNGELDFAEALRERVALLKGQPERILEEVEERITPMPGIEPLMYALKDAGVTCWLVSGGFTCFAEGVAQNLGFDAYFANELVVENGILTGEVATPILDKNSKRKLLERACDQAETGLAASIAIGDGANDIPMLDACARGGGLAVAYHAKPLVRASIENQINHGDLTTLVHALGFNNPR